MKELEWPDGYGRRVLVEVDSTNAEAMRLASELAGPTWILGLRQVAGRGRRGREWRDPIGNFAASLVMRPAEPAAQAALRSFVAALALRDALAALVPGADLTLKWPNDVLLNGCKLAGILLEGVSDGARMRHLVIGIGVNLMEAPPPAEDGALAAVSLRGATGLDVAPEEFLAQLALAYARREAEFVTEGFAPIRAAWLKQAARLGQEVTARMMREEVRGQFETIDAQGHLVLTTPGGRRMIPAADVFF